jgi:hypothetical protein
MTPSCLYRILITAYLIVLAVRAPAQQASPSGSVSLREGLVVQPSRNVAYVMTTDGGIASVNLSSGTVDWISSAAAKPLTVAGNQLVSQVEPKSAAAQRRLEVVGLNLDQNGTPATHGVIDLPLTVRVSVGESVHGRFAASAYPSNNSAILTWDFKPAQLGGMPPPRVTVGQGAPPLTLHQTLGKSGEIRFSLTSGQMTNLTPPNNGAPPASPPPPSLTPVPTEKIDGAPPTQYLSADGRFIVATERIGDDRVWDKYRWIVYERGSKLRVGEIRNHLSFAPFVVSDSVIVFETTPYQRAGEDSQPAKLRGLSLQTGKEVWSVPVREVVWRGPMPP